MRITLSRSLILSAAVTASLLLLPDVGAQEQLTLPVQRPGALPALLASDRVQDELHLTAQQKRNVHTYRARHRDAVQKIVTAADHANTASKQAAQRSIEGVTARYNSQLLATLTPAQKQRLIQIERQLLGGHMLLSADIREKLNLTNEQKIRLARIHRNHQNQISVINGWFEGGEVSNYERVLYNRQERKKQARAMEKILTRDQRNVFDSMAGEPLAFFNTL